MIAMASSAKSFGALATYLATGRSGDEPERVAWSTSRNLPTDDPELAGKIMRATAARNVRVRDPVYHLALSFDPGDAVDRAAMEHVADRVIAALGLREHQILIVAHRDRDHPHMHLLINRVHPETGIVWNRWQDRAKVQQVLREEEQALGLRVVPGRLTPREQLPLTLAIDGPPQSPPPERHSSTPLAETSKAPKVTRIEELSGYLQAHERRGELVDQQYQADLTASAARARLAGLEQALDRAQAGDVAFARALGAVYHDPSAARERFGELVASNGRSDALRVLREHPEQLGALRTVDRTRAFGLVQLADDTPARRAAVVAAFTGDDAMAAEQAARGMVSTTIRRRLDSGLSEELMALYEDPRIAGTALERLINEHGVTGAGTFVRERPGELGMLRPSAALAAPQVATHIERMTHLAEELAVARVRAAPEAPSTMRTDAELTASRADLERASTRAHGIRREIAATPEREDLERRILDLLNRMSPRELRRLRTALAPPHVALVVRLKATLRDVILGREEGVER